MGSPKVEIIDDALSNGIEEIKNKKKLEEEEDDDEDDGDYTMNRLRMAAIMGALTGILLMIFVGIIVVAALQNNQEKHINAYASLIPKAHYYHLKFDKITSSIGSPSTLNSGVKVPDSHNASCLCDYVYQWDCKCDINPEFVITRSKISCYVFDNDYVKQNHRLFYQEEYVPHYKNNPVVGPGDCELSIHYKYHPELEVKPKHKKSTITKEDFESSCNTPLPLPPTEDLSSCRHGFGLCDGELDHCSSKKKDTPHVVINDGLSKIICPENGFCYDGTKPNPNPPVQYTNTPHSSRFAEAFWNALGWGVLFFIISAYLLFFCFLFELACFIIRRIFSFQ